MNNDRNYFKSAAISTCAIFLSIVLAITDANAAQKQTPHYIFNSLTTYDGLSSDKIVSCFETQNGTLCLATDNGLNIYSNGSIHVYIHNPDNPNSIPDDHVRFVVGYTTEVEAIRRKLWIGTDKGICKYDASNESFTVLYDEDGGSIDAVCYTVIKNAIVVSDPAGRLYRIDVATDKVTFLAKSKLDVYVRRICRFASDNQFLISGGNGGLVLLNTSDGSTRHFCVADKNVYALRADVDRNGNVWLCSYEQVICYNSRGKEIRRFRSGKELPQCNMMGLVAIDDKIWVGTRGEGVILIDLEDYSMNYLRHIGGDESSLAGNLISYITKGVSEYVWVCTERCGIDGVKPSSIITYYEVPYEMNNGLSYQTVSCLYDDAENNRVIIGTDGGGINYFDTVTATFRHLPIVGGKHRIKAITRYDRNTLMVAVDGDGLFLVNDANGNLIKRVYIEETYVYENIFRRDRNITLSKADDGIIYMIASEIMRFDTRRGTMELLEDNPFRGVNVSTHVFVDDENCIKFFADNIIYRLDKATFSLEQQFVNDLPMTAVAEGVFGHLAIVDENGFKFRDPDIGEFTKLNIPYGMKVSAMQIDNRRRLWLATNNAILCNVDHSQTFHYFGTTDGVAKSNFSTDANLLTIDGDIYFGAVNGLTHIYDAIPMEMNDAPQMRLLSWSSESKFDFKKRDDNITEISLPSDYHDITVRVSALGYDILGKNIFQFDIRGPVNFHSTTQSDEYRFTMTKSGRYEIWGSCSTDLGYFTEPELLAILHVARPWWLQWWALGTFATILLAISMITIKSTFDAKRRDYEEMMKRSEMQEQENKLNLFTDISHEIRTPLTLIYSPLKRITEELPPNNATREKLQQVMVQVDRLTRLTNMVLDVRKMDIGFDNVVYTDNDDVDEWLRSEAEGFRLELEEHSIDLVFDLRSRLDKAVFDKAKIKTVVSNMMSNAVKYSNPNTVVTVRSEVVTVNNDQLWRVSVDNEGIGLGNKDVATLFERFTRGDNAKQIAGYGVGLSYSNSIVILHRGHMSAYDHDGVTTFYFDIPLNLTISRYSTMDEQKKSATSTIEAPIERPTDVMIARPENAPINVGKVDVPDETIGLSRLLLCTLLIVEDDRSLREYMKEEFSRYFRKVHTAVDGRDGLDRAKTLLPDVIISDVVMPNLNGFEMCRMIKTDLTISHIPVLLLTARTDSESVAMGYKMGADMYMSKPFDVENMLLILNNTLVQRDSIRRKYSQNNIEKIDSKEASFSNADELFLDKLNTIISNNISNPSLDIALILREIGLSRTNFYSKLKQIVGITPVTYINKIRIQKAVELLGQTDQSIADVAYAVGFTDHAYFSSVFKYLTGFSPKDYRAKKDVKPEAS